MRTRWAWTESGGWLCMLFILRDIAEVWFFLLRSSDSLRHLTPQCWILPLLKTRCVVVSRRIAKSSEDKTKLKLGQKSDASTKQPKKPASSKTARSSKTAASSAAYSEEDDEKPKRAKKSTAAAKSNKQTKKPASKAAAPSSKSGGRAGKSKKPKKWRRESCRCLTAA